MFLCVPENYDSRAYPSPSSGGGGAGRSERLTSRINLARRSSWIASTSRNSRPSRASRFAALSDRVLSVWSNRVFPVAPPTRRRRRRQEPRLYARGYRIRPGLWLFHLQTGSLISAKAAAQKRSAQCLGYLRIRPYTPLYLPELSTIPLFVFLLAPPIHKTHAEDRDPFPEYLCVH